jgi:hypothetical protein
MAASIAPRRPLKRRRVAFFVVDTIQVSGLACSGTMSA